MMYPDYPIIVDSTQGQDEDKKGLLYRRGIDADSLDQQPGYLLAD